MVVWKCPECQRRYKVPDTMPPPIRCRRCAETLAEELGCKEPVDSPIVSLFLLGMGVVGIALGGLLLLAILMSESSVLHEMVVLLLLLIGVAGVGQWRIVRLLETRR